MPRSAKPTRLPGSGKVSATSEADFFVKQGDFQAIAGGRPMMFYRDTDKARADWLRGWREYFEESFPAQVAAVDAALGTTPSEDDEVDSDDGNDVA
jgi:ribosome modulation factor